MSVKQAVLLVGGTGLRLGALTTVVNKHLLPVYRVSMAEHNLRWLSAMGINRVAMVCAPDDVEDFRLLVAQLGLDMRVSYVAQQRPGGTARAAAFGIDRARLEGDVVVVLGANIFSSTLPTDVTDGLGPDRDGLIITTSVDASAGPSIGGGLEHLPAYVEQPGPTIVAGPHDLTTGRAVTGAGVVDATALSAFNADHADRKEQLDLVEFYQQGLDAGRVDAHEYTGHWFDAGSSHESLHQAGEHLRNNPPAFWGC